MNAAIIGCSVMGRWHAAELTRCGVRVCACGDADAALAKSLGEAYGAAASTDCEALLRQDEVDIVVIATPTPTHAAYVTAAAKAGKHIFCEKPFTRTLQEAKVALAAVRKAGVKLFVGHVVRYFQEFETMRAEIAAGAIGTPGFARLYRGGAFPGGTGGWFRNYEASGGVTLDCMIHDLDWLRYVFGEPESIYCQALMRSEPVPMDYSQVTMRMRSGLLANVIGSWAHPSGFRVRAEVAGSKGLLQFDSREAPLEVMPRALDNGGGGAIVPASPMHKSPYQLEWEDFLCWLREDRVPRVQPQDAVRALEMGLAALKSAATGKPVTL